MTAQPTWLDDWWRNQIAESVWDRANPPDPGLPAYPWLEWSHPVSMVAAARDRKYPVLVNLDELRRNVQLALAGKPDLRTPQQRMRDAWADYQKAKLKYAPEAMDPRGASQATGVLPEEGREAQEETPSPRGRDASHSGSAETDQD